MLDFLSNIKDIYQNNPQITIIIAIISILMIIVSCSILLVAKHKFKKGKKFEN